MCGQIMEKFFCGETAAEIWANIEEKERHNFYPSSFCASAKVSSLRREGPSLVCRREQILIRYWRCYIIIHQTIPTPHRHMHLLLHSVSVRRIFVPKRDDIYSFLKKQIFHPTNPKHQILIYAVFEEKNCFKFMYFWCKISRPQSF